MSTTATPIVSRIFADGTLLETIYDPEKAATALALATPEGDVRIVESFEAPTGEPLVPYSAGNNLLTSGCVLLPSDIGEFGDKGDMLREIQTFLARYVDLSPAFTEIIPYYVLLTWVYDAFNELPYLRFRGDWGTGKTRALLAVGSISYKPFFASGASTVSPIFHILDAFRGTLVLDEADFRFSDATSDLAKVLNNGNVNGLPVLRTMTNKNRELNPQAFRVFGPKIIAMRESFEDRALESRFLTEETAHRPLSPHIPIHLPEDLKHEALALRNRLLAWRLRERRNIAPDSARLIAGASPRMNQTALALLSLVDNAAVRERIAAHLLGEAAEEAADRRETPDGQVLRAAVEAFAATAKPNVAISEIAHIFNSKSLELSHLPMTNKWVGWVLRTRLKIATTKSHGVYVVPQSERSRVTLLAERFGIVPAEEKISTEKSADSADLHASPEEA
jgi:hypothetical protein